MTSRCRCPPRVRLPSSSHGTSANPSARRSVAVLSARSRRRTHNDHRTTVHVHVPARPLPAPPDRHRRPFSRVRGQGEGPPYLGWLAGRSGVDDHARMRNAGSVTGSAAVKPAPHPHGSVAESSRAATFERVGFPSGGALTARTRVAVFHPARASGQPVLATIHWRSAGWLRRS